MSDKPEAIKTIYSDENLTAIEAERSSFFEEFKKHETIKKIVVGAGFAVLFFFFIVFPKIVTLSDNTLIAFQYGIPLFVLIGMFIFSTIAKKKINTKMKSYFNKYYNSMNTFVLSSSKIKDVILQEPGKITLDEFVKNDIYKNVFEVGSRGLSTFEYSKIPMSVVDAAAQVKGDKRVVPVFVGKYLTADCSYDGTETIIVYLKGKGTVLPPTNIEDKKVVLDDEKMVIYTNYKKWEEVLNEKILKLINEIKTNELLVDVTISLLKGKQYVCLGYDDPLMVIPLQNEFDEKPIVSYKEDLLKALKLMEALH